MFTPADFDKFDHEPLNSLSDRFARARWITGSNIVSKDGFRFEYTPTGLKHISRLAASLQLPQEGKKVSLWKHICFLVKYESAQWRLLPPKLTEGERYYFLAVIASFKKQHPDGIKITDRAVRFPRR